MDFFVSPFIFFYVGKENGIFTSVVTRTNLSVTHCLGIRLHIRVIPDTFWNIIEHVFQKRCLSRNFPKHLINSKHFSRAKISTSISRNLMTVGHPEIRQQTNKVLLKWIFMTSKSAFGAVAV